MEERTSKIQNIPKSMQDAMRGVTWHEELESSSLETLRLLQIPFVDFQGESKLGRLITRADLADSVVEIFANLRSIAFPIASLRPMVDFAGDDGLSMAANNSSCFNSRRIRGTSRISLHALGAAIDINPIQNPVIRGGVVRPDAGVAYGHRRDVRPGMIVPGCDALAIFYDAGWKWGGDWNNPVDYHHFFRE